jgi:hypothetical protein
LGEEQANLLKSGSMARPRQADPPLTKEELANLRRPLGSNRPRARRRKVPWPPHDAKQNRKQSLTNRFELSAGNSQPIRQETVEDELATGQQDLLHVKQSFGALLAGTHHV